MQFMIPESCRELAALQVTQYPADLDAFTMISDAQGAAFVDEIGTPRSILDIGCGLGRMSVWLSWRFPDARFYLADSNEVTRDHPRYGWNPGVEWYNRWAATGVFLAANGLRHYRLIDMQQTDDLPAVDLAVSFLAVGFHWPMAPILDALNAKVAVFGVRSGRYSANAFDHWYGSCEFRPGGTPKETIAILKDRREPCNS